MSTSIFVWIYALLLIIYEAKGLEFDDVLLFNFSQILLLQSQLQKREKDIERNLEQYKMKFEQHQVDPALRSKNVAIIHPEQPVIPASSSEWRVLMPQKVARKFADSGCYIYI